jgi:hypothetical protein
MGNVDMVMMTRKLNHEADQAAVIVFSLHSQKSSEQSKMICGNTHSFGNLNESFGQHLAPHGE